MTTPERSSDLMWKMEGADWPKFCQQCGSELTHTTRSKKYHDVRRGYEVYQEVLVCPKYGSILTHHDLWRNEGTDTNKWILDGYYDAP